MKHRLLLVLLLGACSKAPSSPVEALLSSTSINGAVLVAKGDTILVSRGYGFSNLEARTPNTPQTKFRIGSNSKQFTAAAIVLLAQRGQLSVSDSICRYVSDCPAAWQPVTLAMLMDHSSGIPDYTNFDDFPSLIGSPATPAGLIARFIGAPLEFTPGDRWSYSNSGYVLLGAVIEKVSGQSYADFLGASFFVPLGLTSTGYDSSTPDSTHAQGYLTPSQKPVFIDVGEFYAAGALYSTVEDLYKWDRALMSGAVIDTAQSWGPQIPCPGGCAMGTDVGYGFGWFLSEIGGAKYVYHWGRIDGFVSSNGFYPDDGTIAIVLSNLETTPAFSLGTQLAATAHR